MLRIDTLVSSPLRRSVTPDFFQVFPYQSADGRGYQPLVQALKNGNVVVGENFWAKDYKGDRTLLGKEMVDVDDSTKVYKIGGVSKKVRYNDFWPNYSDRYVAIELTEKIIRVFGDSRLKKCLGQNARRYAEKNVSKAEAVEKYIKSIERLVDKEK